MVILGSYYDIVETDKSSLINATQNFIACTPQPDHYVAVLLKKYFEKLMIRQFFYLYWTTVYQTKESLILGGLHIIHNPNISKAVR